MKKIEIMGCGYIGLPTAVTFTLAGYEVCGFDVKAETVEILNRGKIHIVEPGLQDALTEAMATGRLHFTTTPEPADVFIIAVQTPYRETPEKKRVSDMRFVESAAREVGSVIRPGGLCVLESTSPPGSTRLVEQIVSEVSGLKPEEFMTAHCPERIIPGRMLLELRQNDRIIGSNRPEAAEYAKSIYEKVVTGGTDNHMFLLDLTDTGLTGKQVQEALDGAGITLNKNCVPGDRRSPFQTSGVRIGTAAMTTRGYTAEDFRRVAHRIDAVLRTLSPAENAADKRA